MSAEGGRPPVGGKFFFTITSDPGNWQSDLKPIFLLSKPANVGEAGLRFTDMPEDSRFFYAFLKNGKMLV